MACGVQGHTCVVFGNGLASCWGWNGSGQVMFDVAFEVPVACCGGDVIIAEDVFIFCVQLGDGTIIDRNTPTAVVGFGGGFSWFALGTV